MSDSPKSVRLLERLTARVLTRGGWVVALTAALTLGLGYFLPRLELDVSVESFLEKDDPDLALVQEVVGRFGSAVPTVLAYRDPELFTPQGLRRLDELTRRIADIPYVDRATSLTTASIVTGDETTISISPLADPLPETPEEIEAVRAQAVTHRYLAGNVVSRDGTVAAVVVNMVYVHGHDDEYAPLVVAGMRQAADDILPAGSAYHLAGLSVFYQQMIDYVHRDLAVLTIVPLLLVILLLSLLMRSLPGVVLPLVVVSLTLIWTFGLMAAFGVTLGIASVLLPPLILVIGCADGVHIISQVSEETVTRPGASRRDILVPAMGRVGLAVMVTSLTTSAGFSSLNVSHVRTIQVFGLFAAIGVMIALVLSLTLIPVLLQWWYPKTAVRRRRPMIGRSLDAIGRLNERHPRAILLGWLVLCAAVTFGATRLRVETNFREQFHADSPVVHSLDFIQEHLNGAELMSPYVTTGEDDGILEPEVLRFMNAVAELLRREEEAVRQVDSIVDVLSDARHVLMPETPPGTYVPPTRAEAAQLLLVLESNDDHLAPMLTPERDAARIAARFNTVPTSDAAVIVEALMAEVARIKPAHVELRLIGPVYITQRLVHEVIDSQIRSFGLAFVLIFLMMAVALRSLRLAALSMVPNVLPIAMMVGLMGWVDIPLNDVTIMTASIAIGIAVDDTIHYLVRFRLELARTPEDQIGAMQRTITSVGRAIVTTSVVLIAGFSVSMLASFRPPVYFGILSLTAIAVALAADLILLPVLIIAVTRTRGRRRGSGRPT